MSYTENTNNIKRRMNELISGNGSHYTGRKGYKKLLDYKTFSSKEKIDKGMEKKTIQ